MTGPAPDVAATRSAVRAALADLAPGDLVLVACSGGPDSVALAAATAFVAPRRGLRAGAVVVDHGLQPGSTVVADRAAETCRALGLHPVAVAAVDVRGPGGQEAAAREARYAALEDLADAHRAVAVLLGHTQDDQAETVLLGLARGSGTRSLAGMAPVRGRFRRPFLRLRRAQTAAACDALGLAVWRDPTNEDVSTGRRAAVRHVALPALERALGPGVVPSLARTARLARADADLLDELAAEAFERALVTRDPSRAELAVDVLAPMPPALRGRVLRAAATAVGVAAGSLGAAHADAMAALVTGYHGQGAVALPSGASAVRRCGRLVVHAPSVPR